MHVLMHSYALLRLIMPYPAKNHYGINFVWKTKVFHKGFACMCLWAKDQVEGSWQAPGDVIISLLCSASCSGFLCSSTSCSRLQLLSTGLVQQRPGLLCRRLPARPTPVSDNCVLPTLKHSLSVERAAVLETGLHHCRITRMKQSADQSQTMWAVIWPVQAVTEDIFIRTGRPQCSVNCF